MSNKFIPNVISITTSLLIGYGFYSFYHGEKETFVHLFTSITAFIFSTIMLVTSFGINYETDRIKTVINFVGTTFLVLGIVLLGFIMFFTESLPWLILPMGLLIMIYLSIVYFVSKSGQ
jgi:uncharacterized membrane protein YadS